MTIVYQGGPYARQDDYLVPPPHRLRGIGADGYYERTGRLDADGRLVYQWVASDPAGASRSPHADAESMPA
jgi:hypothetical protein